MPHTDKVFRHAMDGAELEPVAAPDVSAYVSELSDYMAPFIGDGDIVIEWGNESHNWGADGSESHSYSQGRTIIKGRHRR